MTQATMAMPQCIASQFFVRATAWRQFPNVTSPEIGTTDSSISMAMGNRSHSGNHIRKS